MATTSGTWGGDTGLAVPRATMVRLAADAEQSLQALRDPQFVAPTEVAADLDRTLAVTADALEVLTESDDSLDLDQWFADHWTADADERASERVFAYIETHCHPNGPGTAPPDADAPEPPGAAQSPSALPTRPDRHATVHLPDGREFLIGVGSNDTGASVAEFVGESMSMLDPTAEEIPGALDYHSSGYVDAKATLFTPVAQLRDALPDWSFELFDVGDDLVAEHLVVTDPATGVSWCIDIPDSTDLPFDHNAGGCDVPSGLAPVGPPRRPTPDGP